MIERKPVIPLKYALVWRTPSSATQFLGASEKIIKSLSEAYSFFNNVEKITDIVNKALDNGVLPKDIDFKDFGEYKKGVYTRRFGTNALDRYLFSQA